MDNVTFIRWDYWYQNFILFWNFYSSQENTTINWSASIIRAGQGNAWISLKRCLFVMSRPHWPDESTIHCNCHDSNKISTRQLILGRQWSQSYQMSPISADPSEADNLGNLSHLSPFLMIARQQTGLLPRSSPPQTAHDDFMTLISHHWGLLWYAEWGYKALVMCQLCYQQNIVQQPSCVTLTFS